MKTKIKFIKPATVLLLFLFLCSGTLRAIEPSAACTTKLYSKLKESVRYPRIDNRDWHQGTVQVIFTVTREGQVRICHISGTDADLVSYLTKTLPSICCKEFGEAADKFFKVKFDFKLV